MKFCVLFASLPLLLASAQISKASVDILFNQPFTGGMSSNLANYAGVVSNGMSYGIILDSTGNGFLNNYGSFSTSLATFSQLTTTGGALTDDFLVMPPDLTSDSSADHAPLLRG